MGHHTGSAANGLVGRPFSLGKYWPRTPGVITQGAVVQGAEPGTIVSIIPDSIVSSH